MCKTAIRRPFMARIIAVCHYAYLCPDGHFPYGVFFKALVEENSIVREQLKELEGECSKLRERVSNLDAASSMAREPTEPPLPPPSPAAAAAPAPAMVEEPALEKGQNSAESAGNPAESAESRAESAENIAKLAKNLAESAENLAESAEKPVESAETPAKSTGPHSGESTEAAVLASHDFPDSVNLISTNDPHVNRTTPARGVDHTHSPPLSAEELEVLQNSFNALQGRFVVVMREKADLLDKIQEQEVVIAKLASETEAIGKQTSL